MDQHSSSSSSGDKPASSHSTTTFIPPEDRKHSRFGIASFILSIVTLLGYIFLGALGTTMVEPYITEAGVLQPTQETVEAMTTLAAVFIIVMIINLAGLILGIVGCFSKIRKRTVAVIATIVNGVVVLTIGALFLFVLNG